MPDKYLVMGRQKKFDRDKALHKVMELFWRNGFTSLGFETISEETGLSRSTLYAEFGSKQNLYIQAIDRYLDLAMENYKSFLAKDPFSPKNIEKYFLSLDMSGHYHGCFMVRSISEVALDIPPVKLRMKQFLMKLESLYAVNLEVVVLNPSDRMDLAAMLVSFDLGYSILGLAWRSKEDYEKAVRGIILMINRISVKKI